MGFKVGDLVRVKGDFHDYKNQNLNRKIGIVFDIDGGSSMDSILVFILEMNGHSGNGLLSNKEQCETLIRELGAYEQCWWFDDEDLEKVSSIFDLAQTIQHEFINFIQTISELMKKFGVKVEEEIIDGEFEEVKEQDQNIHNHPVIKQFESIFHEELLGGKK